MKMKKYVLRMGGVILLLLALAAAYTGARGLYGLPDGDDYIDMGVHVFVPYKVYRAKVEDGSPYSEEKRMRQRSTVYMAAYKTEDPAGYMWEKHAGTVKEQAEKTLQEGLPVKRRVIQSKKTGRYITVSPQENDGLFLGSLRRSYMLMAALGCCYIAVYAAGNYAFYRRRKKIQSK